MDLLGARFYRSLSNLMCIRDLHGPDFDVTAQPIDLKARPVIVEGIQGY